MVRSFKLMFALATLSACGAQEELTLIPPPSGEGSGGGSLACAMTACEIAKLPMTGTMPTGSAIYAGRASFARVDSLDNFVTTNAALSLNANFTSNSMTLQLSDVTDGATNYTGTAQGSAAVTGAQFAGSFSGNLNSGSGLASISGSLTGQFRGEGAVALDGDIVANDWGGGDAFGRFFANKQ